MKSYVGAEGEWIVYCISSCDYQQSSLFQYYTFSAKRSEDLDININEESEAIINVGMLFSS